MIVLDKNSYFNFSGGEVHGKYPIPGNPVQVLMKDYSMDGLMALAQYCEVAYRNKSKVHVIYPYFPYARQDRVMAVGEPFSLRIFCKFLNSLSLASVTVIDPHSDVVGALVHDVRIIPQWDILSKNFTMEMLADKNTMFISPDAGAYKKVSKFVLDDRHIAIGVKQRDAAGNVSGTDVFSPVSLNGKQCIILDDICDGGRTFIELAKVLKQKGAASVSLYVTHGIFSKGLLPLKDAGIEHVYTTDSFPQEKDNFLTVKELDYVG